MTALDYILDGLEAELALERELGVRVVEIDRALLAPPRQSAPTPPAAVPSAAAPSPVAPSPAPRAPEPVAPSAPASTASVFPFVFLHDRPLSPAGTEMMAKIVAAMGKTSATAPVIVAPPLPKAKVYIVLGGLALKRWFPGLPGAPNQWTRTAAGQDVLVTNSPEYILRFKTVTPAVQKIKKEMWTAIKSVLQRVRLGS